MLVLASVFLLAGHARADIIEAIAKVKSSIVVVGTYKATNSPRFNLRGTGFAVGDGNLIVTNAHVLPAPSDEALPPDLVIQVKRSPTEFQMRVATVVEVDKLHDLALLRVGGTALPALALRDSDQVREGQSIALMGFPIGGVLGFSPVTHRGMISSITPVALPTPTAQQLNEQVVRRIREGTFDIFQLDATAYPGNSGGPLFDAETGEVLGVVNMVFIKGGRESALTHPSGISYAIPANFVTQMLQRRK
ncbi:MAG TPA: serine protease [Burkholderiaceae bacterium]|nr:serine protease [Burkholderiaceae bacterium]